MLFNWISGVLQGVFGTLIYEALLAGGVGVLIGVLKAKREKWAGPALYGFAAFVLCFVLGFTLLGHGPLSKESPQTTSQNVEANIRAWADDFNLSIKKMEAANVEFQYAL